MIHLFPDNLLGSSPPFRMLLLQRLTTNLSISLSASLNGSVLSMMRARRCLRTSPCGFDRKDVECEEARPFSGRAPVPLPIHLSTKVIWSRMPRSCTRSHPYQGRSGLTSAVTSRQRVRDPPTRKLQRLALETDPVRHALDAFHGAHISRTPCADYQSLSLIHI